MFKFMVTVILFLVSLGCGSQPAKEIKKESVPEIKTSGKEIVAPEVVKETATIEEAWKKRVFSREELKKFDGQEGRPAYVAVEGIVYDLSKIGPWKGGLHMNRHLAGEDLTQAFLNEAPKKIHHEHDIRLKLPKVGILLNEKMPENKGK